MAKRLVLTGVFLGLLPLVVTLTIGVAGCGSGSPTTTIAPSTTTTAVPSTTTTAVVTSTTSAPTSSTTQSSGPLTLERYGQQLMAFVAAAQNLSDVNDPSNFTDVSAVTAAQLEGAKQFAAAVHAQVDQLKAIQPPAEVAAAHQKITAEFDQLAADNDKLITAIENKDQATFDAVIAQGNALQDTLQADLAQLVSRFSGSTASS